MGFLDSGLSAVKLHLSSAKMLLRYMRLWWDMSEIHLSGSQVHLIPHVAPECLVSAITPHSDASGGVYQIGGEPLPMDLPLGPRAGAEKSM